MFLSKAQSEKHNSGREGSRKRARPTCDHTVVDGQFGLTGIAALGIDLDLPVHGDERVGKVDADVRLMRVAIQEFVTAGRHGGKFRGGVEADHAGAGIHILEFGKDTGSELQRERNAVDRQLDATAELVGVCPAFLLRNASIAIRIDQGENPAATLEPGVRSISRST